MKPTRPANVDLKIIIASRILSLRQRQSSRAQCRQHRRFPFFGRADDKSKVESAGDSKQDAGSDNNTTVGERCTHEHKKKTGDKSHKPRQYQIFTFIA